MAIRTRKKTEVLEDLKEPKLYKVIMHNDDVTTMEFVVEVLVYIFNKDLKEAVDLMMYIHTKGSGVAGVYPFDIAVTKIEETHKFARAKGFPLKCTMEEE